MTALKGIVLAFAVAPMMVAQSAVNTQATVSTADTAAAPVAVYSSAPAAEWTGSSSGTTIAPVTSGRQSVLHDGTPVRIRLTRTLSSEQAKTGDEIDFDVLDEIRVDDRVIVSSGSKAIGVVSEAEAKRRMGRGGKLNIALSYVRMQDGTKIALRAQRDTKGGGHVGAMSAGMVASVALGFGLPAPLFLLMHGKEAVVPAGTEMTAYVNGDIHLPPAVFVAGR